MSSSGTLHARSGFDPDVIPAEIWMEIFEWLPQTTDIYNVLLTCRKFRGLTIRALHRDVVWQTPEHYAQDYDVWRANPGMTAVTHTAKIGFSTIPPVVNGWIVDLDGSTYRRRNELIGIDAVRLYNTVQYYRLEKSNFASQSLYDSMLFRVSSFTNLENLAFYDVIFTNRHFALIHELPKLQKLRLEFCVFPNRTRSRTFDHSTLPITELTMVNLRRRIAENHGDHSVTVEEDIVHVLSLATAQNLRVLRVDSTADVFRNVFSGWEAERHGFRIPPLLEQLYVLRKRCVPREIQPIFPGESTFPDTTLLSFLVRAASITTYSTYHPSAPNLLWGPEMLPHVRHFSGPIESVAGMPSGQTRPIEALALLKCGYGVRDGVGALASIASMFPKLVMLALEFRTWDDEIIHAVTSLFPQLRRLKIVCENGGPNETTLVSMGPEFLARLRNLRTLQMYSTSLVPFTLKPDYPRSMFDESYSCIGEELRNLVIPWNRWCPSLREVQLLPGFVLRRGYDGGAWQVDKVSKLQEWEDFNYIPDSNGV